MPIHDRAVPEAGDNVVRAMLHNDRPHWAAESLANEARTNRTDTLPKGDCVLALALVHHSTSPNSFPSPYSRNIGSVYHTPVDHRIHAQRAWPIAAGAESIARRLSPGCLFWWPCGSVFATSKPSTIPIRRTIANGSSSVVGIAFDRFDRLREPPVRCGSPLNPCFAPRFI